MGLTNVAGLSFTTSHERTIHSEMFIDSVGIKYWNTYWKTNYNGRFVNYHTSVSFLSADAAAEQPVPSPGSDVSTDSYTEREYVSVAETVIRLGRLTA